MFGHARLLALSQTGDGDVRFTESFRRRARAKFPILVLWRQRPSSQDSCIRFSSGVIWLRCSLLKSNIVFSKEVIKVIFMTWTELYHSGICRVPTCPEIP